MRDQEEPNKAQIEQARAAKNKLAALLRDLPELNGIGLTRAGDGFAVKINLSGPPGPGTVIPAIFEGVPVLVETVGPVTPRGRRP